MTTQYSHCSKGHLWHFYNSNFFPCLLVHYWFLDLKQDSGGRSRVWCLSAFLRQAPGPLLVQEASARFPERAVALLSKEYKALLGISVGFMTLEWSVGELPLAHRGAGIGQAVSWRSCTIRPVMQDSIRPGAGERVRWCKSSQTSVECHQVMHVCPWY